MEGKSLSKKAIIAIVIIAILVIAAISMVVVFLRDQGETEATAIGENSSNSEQTQDAVPDNNGDNNQGTATQSEEPQQEEQTTVADNDGATTTNVGTTTPATTTTAPAQQTTTTTDGSTQVATTTTTETIPTQALTLAWSNMTVSGGELLANIDANVTDVTAPIVRTLYILNVSDENRRQYIRDGETLKVEVNFNEILAQNPTLTIGTGENTQTVEFGFYPIENWPYRYVANIKVDNTILGLADGTQIPFTITNIVDRDNTLTLDNDDVTYTAEYGQVTYENTAPQIIIKGTPGYEEEGKNYIGSLEENTFSYISFKFFDTTMLKGKYGVNDTLITGKKADKEGEADFSEFDEYLVQGENTIRVWDMAGNMTEYTFTYDSIAPKASFVRIQNNSQNNEKYAKVGDKIWVYVTIPNSEAATAPKIKINGVEARVFVNENNTQYDYVKYVGEVVMTEDMAEGPIEFLVYGYKDIAGNDGVEYTASTDGSALILDKTAPVADFVEFTSTNANNQLAKVGDQVWVKVRIKEELAKYPVIKINGKPTDQATIVNDVNEAGTVYVAWLTITEDIAKDIAEGKMTFEISGYTDLAGNVGETIVDKTTNGTSVTFDKSAPEMVALGMLNDTHYNEGKDITVATTGDRIRLRVAFKEMLAVNPKVEIIGENGVTEVECTYREQTSNPSADYYMYMSDFTITEAMDLPEGEIQFIITGYADAAGNVGDEITQEQITETAYPGVVYDTVAPEYSAMGIFNWTNNKYGGDITVATANEHIRLYVAFPEMLAVNPKVDIYGENGKVTTMDLAWSEAAQFYFVEFDTTEDLQLPQGKIQYRIYGYEDAAGNVGDDLNQEDTTSKEYPYVIYDTVPAEYTALGIVNGSHYDAKEGDIYHAKTGDYVRILVQFDNEKLAVMPKIRILGADNKVVKEVNMIDAYLTSASQNTNAYSGQFTITEDMNLPEGEIKFEVYGYEDLAGNVGRTLTNTDLKYPGIDQGVEYDKTAPVADFVEFTTTNKNNQYAKVGDQVWVKVRIKEELSKMPVIKINGITTNTVINDPAGVLYVGWITMTEDMTEGKMSFEISGYEDLAGNVGDTITTTTNNTSVTFDKTAPYAGNEDASHPLYILNVSDANRRQWIRNGGTLRVEANFNEDMDMSIIPVLTIGTENKTQTANFEYKDTVDGKRRFVADITINNDILGLADGTQIPFTVTNAFDLAGNEAVLNNEDVTFTSEYGQVTYDNTAPENKSVGIFNRTKLDIGDTKLATTNEYVRIYASFREKLEVEPTARIYGKDGKVVAEHVLPYDEAGDWYFHDFQITDAMDLPEGEIKFDIVGYADAAGNVGVDLGNEEAHKNSVYPQVVYDKTAPKKLNLGIARNKDEGDTRDQRYAKAGDSIRVLVSFSEKLAVEPKVEIFGKVYDVTYRPKSSIEESNIYYYMADVKIDQNTPEGDVVFKVFGYKDAAGNEGLPLTNADINDGKYTNVIIDNTNPTILPTEDSVSGSKDNYSRIGFKVTDNYGVASYEINGETLILTNGEISYEKLKEYLKEGSNTVTASDEAGNTATYTFNYDATAPTREYSNIMVVGDDSQEHEFYAKVGDKIWVSIGVKEELLHNPTFTLINNGIEYPMDDNLVKASYDKENNRYSYVMTYQIPSDTSFVDGEITFKISDLVDLFGNRMTDETKPSNSNRVFFDKTNPIITVNDNAVGNAPYFRDNIGFTVSDNYGIASCELNGTEIDNNNGKISFEAIKDKLNVNETKNTLTVKDLSGNEVSYEFWYDYKAPKANFVQIRSNKQINKDYAQPGDDVWVYIKIKEELSVLPTIVINGQKVDTFKNGEPNENGQMYAGKLKMTRDMENGEVSFKIYGYADKAGNVGATIENETTDKSHVIFDKDAPTVSEVHIQNMTRGGSEAKVGDKIWLYVTVTEKEADLSHKPNVTINGKEANVFVNDPTSTYTKYVAEIVVTEDMKPGEMTFNISAYTDRAGNVGKELTTTTDGSSMTIVE